MLELPDDLGNLIKCYIKMAKTDSEGHGPQDDWTGLTVILQVFTIQLSCRTRISLKTGLSDPFHSFILFCWYSSTWPNSIFLTKIPLAMDKLQLTGQKLGRVFNFRSGHLHAVTILVLSVKLPNLQLKTQPKQLLGSLPLIITLPALADKSGLKNDLSINLDTVADSICHQIRNQPVKFGKLN